MWIQRNGLRRPESGAIKTMAQVAGSMLVIGAFSDTAWSIMLQTTFVAGLSSILTSIAGLPEVESED